MQRVSQKARYEFIHLLMKHATVNESITEGDIQRAATKLLRYGATLGRLAEEQCNGYQTYDGRWDEKATERSERKEARIREQAEKVAASIGCKVITQGDPRGNVLKVVVPDGYTNDWGREGICVPTS
jgi:hypothetical protein